MRKATETWSTASNKAKAVKKTKLNKVQLKAINLIAGKGGQVTNKSWYYLNMCVLQDHSMGLKLMGFP